MVGLNINSQLSFTFQSDSQVQDYYMYKAHIQHPAHSPLSGHEKLQKPDNVNLVDK